MKYVDQKYIKLLSSYVDRFTDNGNDTYNFRCPYCGDSQKSKYKARGYIFSANNIYIYKCHNCNISTNLEKFLKDNYINLHNEYKKDKFKETFKPTKPKDDIKLNSIKTDTANRFKLRKHIGNKILSSLDNARDVNKAIDYLESRMIPSHRLDRLYYVDDINTIISKLPKYKNSKTNYPSNDAIVIPFVSEQNIVTHLQMRLFDGDLRYMTLECEPTDYKIYGLDFIDKNKKVYVCEGSFDSMFINNCIAVTNANLHAYIDYCKNNFKDYVLLYDKDLIYNKQVINSVYKALDKKANIVLYDMDVINSNAKDINDMVKMGLVKNVNRYLDDNTYRGLQARLYLDKIKKIDKHHTSNPFTI